MSTARTTYAWTPPGLRASLTDLARADGTGCACCRGTLLPVRLTTVPMCQDISVTLRLCDDCAQRIDEATHACS